MKAKSTILL